MDADGKPDQLLLRTGSTERSPRGVGFIGSTDTLPEEIVSIARAFYGDSWQHKKVLVKNFDTEEWHVVLIWPQRHGHGTDLAHGVSPPGLAALGAERDALRELRDDIDDFISSNADAASGIEQAIDALSRYA